MNNIYIYNIQLVIKGTIKGTSKGHMGTNP